MSNEEDPALSSSKSKQSRNSLRKCQECDSLVTAYSTSETTYLTFILTLTTVLILNLWSVFLLPFLIPLSKSLVLRCSLCDYIIETHQPHSLLSLKGEILTLKCGDCALVISRTYFLAAVSLISLFLIFSSNPAATPIKPALQLQTTWPEYLKDCGGEVILQNSIKVTETFSQKYSGNIVSWDGYLMRLTHNYGWFKGDHAVVMLVKMNPSESDIHADLILSMDDKSLYSNKNILIGLSRGSHFEFNATFVTVGNEQQLHHLHAQSLEPLEGYLEIPDNVHSVNHRYSLKPQSSSN